MASDASDRRTPGRGEGIIYGGRGVYHYPVAHDLRPLSTDLGYGHTADALCGRARGIVYAESMKNLWPSDQPCKRCVKAAADGDS